jgi:hypothetical protein
LRYAPERVIVRSLLHDGRLRLEAHPRLLPTLERWLPLLPDDGAVDPHGAVLRVLPTDGRAPDAVPDLPRTLRLGDVDAWVDGDVATLAGGGVLRGRIALDARVAEVRFDDSAADGEAAAWTLYSAATLACALLLGRMGRALAHAAAVAPPEGPAWLLVGDTHAGKTTTCANLVQGGWNYLSDDHVVLYRDSEGRVAAEGWPRAFHLDEGWEAGSVARRRGETDPHARFPGRWRREAPLAGLLFPRIAADAPTALEPARAPDALQGLLRQSPWLLADRGCAPRVLALLRETALLPAHALRLGLDTYADPDRLVHVVGGAATSP